MEGVGSIVALAFKAIALCLAVASIVLAALKVGSFELYVILLGAGLLTLAISAIIQPQSVV